MPEENEGSIPPIPYIQDHQMILSLSPKSLIKIGISENHLRTAAIILAFFVTGADYVNQFFDYDVYDTLENTNPMSWLVILNTLIIIPLFIGASFTITLIRTVLKYYDLKFWREGKSYKVVSGLFTRNEKSIQKSKIQVIGGSRRL